MSNNLSIETVSILNNVEAFIAELTTDFSHLHPQAAGRVLADNWVDRHASTDEDCDAEEMTRNDFLVMAHDIVEQVRLGNLKPSMTTARACRTLAYAFTALGGDVDVQVDQLMAVYSAMLDYTNVLQQKLS